MSRAWRTGALFGTLCVAGLLAYRSVFPLSTADLFHIQFAAYEWHKHTPELIYTTYDPARQNLWLKEWKVIAARLGADQVANLHVYPPFVAAVLSPVADVPARWWRNAMFALNIALVIVLTSQTLQLSRISFRPVAFGWALALVIACKPVESAVRFGQITLLLTVLTWSGLLALRRGKEWSAGILIGLASGPKLSPIGMLIYPMLQRKWRSVVGGIAALAALFGLSVLTLGFAIHRVWWNAMRDVGSTVWTNALDQSVTAWFVRVVLGGSVAGMPFPATPLISIFRIGVVLVVLGSTLLILWRARKNLDDQAFPPAVGFLLAGTLLSLPFVWNYYLAALTPVLGWSICRWFKHGDTIFWTVWLWASVLLFCVSMYHLYGDSLLGRILSSTHMYGLLLLWGWLMRYVVLHYSEVRTPLPLSAEVALPK